MYFVVNFVFFELGVWSEGFMTSWESTAVTLSLIILEGAVYLPKPTLAEKLQPGICGWPSLCTLIYGRKRHPKIFLQS